MRCMSQSAERQQDIELSVRGGIARIYLRKDHAQVTGEDGDHWECAEASMICAEAECPTREELAESFDDWFEYAAEWQPARQKSLSQLQADIEFIAAMTGIELEG